MVIVNTRHEAHLENRFDDWTGRDLGRELVDFRNGQVAHRRSMISGSEGCDASRSDRASYFFKQPKSGETAIDSSYGRLTGLNRVLSILNKIGIQRIFNRTPILRKDTAPFSQTTGIPAFEPRIGNNRGENNG